MNLRPMNLRPMNPSASGTRSLLTLAALAPVAAFLTACGTVGSSTPGSPATTVTFTESPSNSPTSSPTESSQTTPTSAGPSECRSAGLHVRVASSNGAAGTIYYNLDFVNVSASTCFVRGYPGVSLVSAGSDAGSQIGADAKRDPVTPSKTIILAPGQTAHAVLGVAEALNFPSSKCRPVNAHWLKVFPPDQTVALYAPFTTQTCASTSVATIRITTISAGA
jgi:hypothetical protein